MYEYLKNKRALYIEDEISVLRNISELLKNFFMTFYIATDGEMGLKLFKEKKIDVLLVDIELPKVNGIDLIKKIRKTNKNIPIVIISAYTKTDYLLDSIELGLCMYIVKPLTSKKINKLLSQLNNNYFGDNLIQITPSIFLYLNEMKLTHSNKEYALTKKEVSILEVLSRKKIILYEEIYSLWEPNGPSQNAVRSCIKQLRKKLPEDFLKNRNGIGYFIDS